MRGKLMVVSVVFLAALMLVPVTAKPIGPRKAEKNPHIRVEDGEVVLLTPGGVQNEWRDTEAGVFDFFHILNASKTVLPKVRTFTIEQIAALMTNSTAALESKNKWGYISQETLLALLILMGVPEGDAEALASVWPAGMYFRYHNVAH